MYQPSEVAAAIEQAARLAEPVFEREGWFYWDAPAPVSRSRFIEGLSRLFRVLDAEGYGGTESGRFFIERRGGGGRIYLVLADWYGDGDDPPDERGYYVAASGAAE